MEEQAIVFFDRVCNFCNQSVQFIINRDKKGYFKFAPLQSEVAQDLLLPKKVDLTQCDTIVLLEAGQVYMRSVAALRIARHLSGLWPMMYLFIIVPRVLRDAGYNFVAKRRYRWFGKREACMLPSPEIRSRFLT